MRAPKLEWDGAFAETPAGRYMVQSEIVRGEPRVYYAKLLRNTVGKGDQWSGPSRKTQRAAMIDAEYHAAGLSERRPRAMAYEL